VKIIEPNISLGRWDVRFEVLTTRVDEKSGQKIHEVKSMRAPSHNGTPRELAANFGFEEGDIVDIIALGKRGLRMRKLTPEFIAEREFDEAELMSHYQDWLVLQELADR
jgi:hypothetical protein